MNTSVVLCGMELSNPIIPASGTFGFGAEFQEWYDIHILGSFVLKGTTCEERYGNELPRVAECPMGMLNAVGLQNPGVDAVIARELPRIKEFFHKPVIANISGFSTEEYVACAVKLDQQPQIGILEINVSCPNVAHGGMTFGTDPKAAAEITRAVKDAVRKPIFIKLSPNVTDIAEIASACAEAGADGLSLINTILGMRIDLRTRKPVLANRYGGLSGPAVLPVALRMVHQVAAAVRIPIMGMGGVSNAYNVIEMMMAGATAVQVGAANLADPCCCKKIVESLPEVMAELGIQDLREIIGAAR